jgi:2-C-methyl-D-erythritol 4-phosphate cytidylyltransferase
VAGSGAVWTIVVGAGAGTRFGGPKQYESLGEMRVIDHAVAAATAASDGVVVVVRPEDADCEQAIPGGATRAASVRAGLAAVPDDAAVVCVHDAARPFADTAVFAAVIAAVRGGADGAVPGVAVTDTVKVVADVINGVRDVVSTPARSSLVAVQTPQAFDAAVLRRVHDTDAHGEATDDASMVEATGGRVVVVAGDPLYRKITTPEDLAWARGIVTDGGMR